MDRQVELAHHLAYDHELLVVFLTKHCAARLRTAQQLEHHGAHPGKKTRAELAFKYIGQGGRRGDTKLLRLRVELLLVGRKEQVATGRFKLRAVGAQGARVGVKVVLRTKLEAVDENRGHRDIT